MRHRARTDLYRGQRVIAVPTVTYKNGICDRHLKFDISLRLVRSTSAMGCSVEGSGYEGRPVDPGAAGANFRQRGKEQEKRGSLSTSPPISLPWPFTLERQRWFQ